MDSEPLISVNCILDMLNLNRPMGYLHEDAQYMLQIVNDAEDKSLEAKRLQPITLRIFVLIMLHFTKI